MEKKKNKEENEKTKTPSESAEPAESESEIKIGETVFDWFSDNQKVINLSLCRLFYYFTDKEFLMNLAYKDPLKVAQIWRIIALTSKAMTEDEAEEETNIGKLFEGMSKDDVEELMKCVQEQNPL